MSIDQALLDQLIYLALKEDVGDGDHTSLSCIPPSVNGKARLLVKEEGVLCGVNVAEAVFLTVDPNLKVTHSLEDGIAVIPGDVAFYVEGSALSILTSERLVLNLMQRMSGIATKTRKFCDAIAGTHARIIDTRKTTPGIRFLEKYAVTVGGGANHRIGLYDMILLKDNHIDFCGGITNAITAANSYLKEKGKSLRIEIETRNLAEVNEVLECGNVDRIMLDNFNPAQVKQAVDLIAHRYETEASGGINLDNVWQYAEAGVDYISVGALTHSAVALDLSLKAEIVK